jgi:hypothetical protein
VEATIGGEDIVATVSGEVNSAGVGKTNSSEVGRPLPRVRKLPLAKKTNHNFTDWCSQLHQGLPQHSYLNLHDPVISKSTPSL